MVPPVASTRMRGRLVAAAAALPGSAACAGILIGNDEAASEISGTESIDIRRCRRLADLTVWFVIKVTSRFLRASMPEMAPPAPINVVSMRHSVNPRLLFLNGTRATTGKPVHAGKREGI